jgi:hypothetical protein
MRSRFFKPEEPPKELSVYEDAVKSRGGGIVVMATVDGTSKTVEVRCVGAGDYQPPKRFLMLSPGRPPYFCDSDGANKVSAASHMIVPVDAEAEQQLKVFYDQLPWFSPDFESLVLNALRKPSIDSRLDDLEARVYGQTTGESQKEAGRGPWERIWLALQNVLSNGTTYALLAVGVIIVLLFIDVWRLQDLKGAIDARQTAQSLRHEDKAPAPVKPKTETAEEKETKKLTAATQQFLTELGKEKESNEKLKDLYDQYFQNFRPDAKDMDKWYAPDGEDNQLFLSGLIEAQKMKDRGKRPDAMSKQFTRAINCRQARCADANDDDITAGLKNLTEYLKTQK